jgi:uncharacterized protein (TIGR02145 family)
MKKNYALIVITLLSIFTIKAQTITDIEGNIYNTVTIDNQEWMKENLRVAHYRNGDSIFSTIPANLDITNQIEPKYQWAFDGIESNVIGYGRFYTWYALMDGRGVCPIGWTVPTNDDWKQLEMFLGMTQAQVDSSDNWRGTTEGGKLKETGLTYWYTPNLGATNETGFTAYGSGLKYRHGDFDDKLHFAYLWTSSQLDGNIAWCHTLGFMYSKIGLFFMNKDFGLSVRCIKNVATYNNEMKSTTSFKIYPNPANDYLIIQNQTTIRNEKLVIKNEIGQNIITSIINGNQTHLDISRLKQGIYFVEVWSDNNRKIVKLIKQ